MSDQKYSRIPAHPPTPQGYSTQAPQRYILMTPYMAAIGGLFAFFSVVLMVVILPTTTYNPPPSTNWLPLTNSAYHGRAVYLANGCVYCHSQYTRPQDVYTQRYYLYPRISLPGDIWGEDQSPNLLGTERTGPDLSQEGGNHPVDWHVAHYNNPRNTTPLSIMPIFSFFTPQELTDTIAFNEESGGKEAVLRFAAQTVAATLGKISDGSVDPAVAFPQLVAQLTASGEYKPNGTGDDTSPSGLPWGDVFDLNTFERSYWITQDPLPVTQDNLVRARQVFQDRCVGCHGATGHGDGPAAQFMDPKPDDFSGLDMFTSATDSDGERYHRILTGGRGTAMENFGTRLSVDDVWRLVLFLRTIPNGGFDQPVTTVDRYQPWQAPQELLNYIQTHPIAEPSLAPSAIASTDPFLAAAHWIFGGLAPGDTILVGGKLPITLQRTRDLVQSTYNEMVQHAYNEAKARGEELPSEAQIMDTTYVTWHDP